MESPTCDDHEQIPQVTMIMTVAIHKTLVKYMRQFLQRMAATDKQATSTLLLRQKLKQPALYKQLNVTGDLDLISLNRFNYTKNIKKDTTIL